MGSLSEPSSVLGSRLSVGPSPYGLAVVPAAFCLSAVSFQGAGPTSTLIAPSAVAAATATAESAGTATRPIGSR